MCRAAQPARAAGGSEADPGAARSRPPRRPLKDSDAMNYFDVTDPRTSITAQSPAGSVRTVRRIARISQFTPPDRTRSMIWTSPVLIGSAPRLLECAAPNSAHSVRPASDPPRGSRTPHPPGDSAHVPPPSSWSRCTRRCEALVWTLSAAIPPVDQQTAHALGTFSGEKVIHCHRVLNYRYRPEYEFHRPAPRPRGSPSSPRPTAPAARSPRRSELAPGSR